MNKQFLSFLIILSTFSFASAQDTIIKLWPNGVPNQRFSNSEEIVTKGAKMRVRNVQDPEILVYQPSEFIATGQAVLIMPGGGYYHMALEKEGVDVAKWLNSFGITGVVLKYRLPHTENLIEGHKAPLQDAQQAIRVIRKFADDWHLDSTKIGVMGFSAGGHLASTLLTQFDRDLAIPNDTYSSYSPRPDFGCLVYPVISMDETIVHQGSRRNLLGKNPSEELMTQYSNENHVNAKYASNFYCAWPRRFQSSCRKCIGIL